MAAAKPKILTLRDVEVLYDHTIVALRGVSFDVEEGTIVALLGGNGAGKTTTLKAASSLLSAEGAELSKGTVNYRGQPTTSRSPRFLAAAGMVQVLEGRHCFPQLTVEENLVTGALVRRLRPSDVRRELERVYALFPALRTSARCSPDSCPGESSKWWPSGAR